MSRDLDAQGSFDPAYGKYRLLEKIAEGGMAEVFRAVSNSIGGFQKVVAVKRILPQLSMDAEFVSLFIDEAKLTVSLSHSNIVQVLDFGRIENNYYIAMEYVDGRDLTKILVKQTRRRQLVPIEVGCYILAYVLRGLEYANSRKSPGGEFLGIVHRDVSPHNILVSFDGEVKVADFGIAKARTKVSLTRPGVVLGKFAYMSPEQANGADVDARSDVYSAGITLFETVTGRRLFYAESATDVLAKVRDPRVPMPSQYNPAIPPELDDIILRALARAPRDRYPTCRAFSPALDDFLTSTAPKFNDSHLVGFMKDLFEDDVGSAKFPMAAHDSIAHDSTAQRRGTRSNPVKLQAASTRWRSSPSTPNEITDSPVLLGLLEKLRQAPDLWTLYDVAEALRDLNRTNDAQTVYRVAAAKFAQAGLLAQAVAMYVSLRDLVRWNAALALEAEGIRGLPWCSNEVLKERGFETADPELKRVFDHILSAPEPRPASIEAISPLFAELDAAEFSNIVSLLRLYRVPAGQLIMKEGDAGDWLGVIARGRVVVYFENEGEKTYLSSLSDGSCIGEFSFFTGEPRAATVETLEPVLYLAIGRADFDDLGRRFPSFTSALSVFYRRRVVANMLAKSDVFRSLRAGDRADLVEHLAVETFSPGTLIVQEGDDSDSFYLLQSGMVEIFSERPGIGVLQKLAPGSFFGEIATVTGQRRTASVRALAPSEVLKISRDDMDRLMAMHPEVRSVLVRSISVREQDTARRLGGEALI